jgi:hypothetical protein
VLVADVERDPLVLEVVAGSAADVEDLGLASEHDRVISASQASLRARAAVTGSPVSSIATPEASRRPSSWSRVMVTTTVASTPPAWGSRSTG